MLSQPFIIITQVSWPPYIRIFVVVYRFLYVLIGRGGGGWIEWEIIKVELSVFQHLFLYEHECCIIISMLKFSNFQKFKSNNIMFLPLFCYSSFSSINEIRAMEVALFTIFFLHNKVRVLSNLCISIIRIRDIQFTDEKFKSRTSIFILWIIIGEAAF